VAICWICAALKDNFYNLPAMLFHTFPSFASPAFFFSPATSSFFFFGFTIFHGLWPGRHHFLWAHKVRDCLLNSFAASSLDKEQKLISFLPRPNSFQQHKNIVNGV